MGAEMQATHRGSVDPELDESILNSSLLHELDKFSTDIEMPQAPTHLGGTALSQAAPNKEMQVTQPPDQSLDTNLKPTAKAPPPKLKPRAMFTDATKQGRMKKLGKCKMTMKWIRMRKRPIFGMNKVF
jgi:hypothetical protein